MNKLLEAFLKNPTEQARAKLQTYLAKHPMSVCMASPEQHQALKQHGFNG
jgi:hypothetical protein